MERQTNSYLLGFFLLVIVALIWWRADTFYTTNNTYATKWHRFIGIAQNQSLAVPDTARVRENITSNNLDLRNRKFIDQTDTAIQKPLILLHPGRHFFWWQTPVKNLPADSALAHFKDGEFKNWRGNPFRQMPNPDHYWFYIIIKNESSRDTVVLWSFADLGCTVCIYQVLGDSQCVKLDSSSMHAPINQRPFSSQILGFPIYMTKGQAGAYMAKVQKTTVRAITVWQGLGFRDAMWEGNGKDAFTVPIFFGFYPFAIFFSLIFFFVLRDRIYLLQGLYIFWGAILAGSSLNYFTLILPDQLYVIYSYMPLLLPAIFSTLFITLIFKEFTKTKEVSPVINRCLNVSLALNTFALFCSVLTYLLYFIVREEAFFEVMKWLRIPGVVFLFAFFPFHILCAAYLYNKVDTKTKIYCASVIFTLFFWAFNMTNFAGLTNRTFIHPNNLVIGLSVEILVFAVLMVYRYREERIEKETLLESKLAMQQYLTQSVIEAQETERKRIAEELHDGLGGFLTGLRFMVSRKKSDFEKSNNPDAENVMHDVERKLDKAIKDVRDISHNLMPIDFNTKAFTEILREHLHYLNENGNVQFEYYMDERANKIAQAIQISLFRIISELIRNVQIHSGASLATIQLVAHAEHVLLQVEDNGNGFTPGKSGGIGLKNIQSRVSYWGGKMNIDSVKLYTTIHIEIPVTYSNS